MSQNLSALIDCPPPHPTLAPASFSIPAGACDTHAHVISLEPRYPLVATRSYTPPPASPDAYLAMLNAQGMERGVLVQVSVHGTDNRYMVETLQAHPDRLRGIAVVAPDVSDAALQTLDDAGVRGLRINVLFGGGVGFDAMETLARRIAPMGWHMQFLLDVNQLDDDLMRRLTQLPCPGIIDHMGFARGEQGIESPGFRKLLRLVNEAGYWVKLSGAYRISDDFEQYRDVVALAQTLVAAAPDRMVWGSDWPHVNVAGPMPNTGVLRNALPQWIPDDATRRKILVENPARLYGFPASHRPSRNHPACGSTPDE